MTVRAVSSRECGRFYGYRIHAAVCTKTGLPLVWQVETARSHESTDREFGRLKHQYALAMLRLRGIERVASMLT